MSLDKNTDDIDHLHFVGDRVFMACVKEYLMKLDEKYWSRSINFLLKEYDVDPIKGLSHSEVVERQKIFGFNLIKLQKPISNYELILRQFKSLIVIVLAIATILPLVLGQYFEAIFIFFVILSNATIGFFTEHRAIRSMEALKNLGVTHAKIFRNNNLINIEAQEIVPGDIIFLEGGDIVPADIRVIESSGALCDESSFSGESQPVAKNHCILKSDTSLLERENTLFKGTSIIRGSVKGLTVATGSKTELGKIAHLTQSADDEMTPLEKKLNDLGKKLIYLCFILGFLIAILGIGIGKSPLIMIEIAIALAVAAIPEGLPIVATIALANGMLKMAKNNALINKLSAVETLGAVNIIFADKTGTITENAMQISRLQFKHMAINLNQKNNLSYSFESPPSEADYSLFYQAIKIGVLCSNANLGSLTDHNKMTGDNMEIELLKLGSSFDLNRAELLSAMPEIVEESFNFEKRRMATIHALENGFYTAVKGAPESILEISTRQLTQNGIEDLNDAEKKVWYNYNLSFAGKGERVLALAFKETVKKPEIVYRNLVLVALVCLRDPPRKQVRESIQKCREAGVRPIMLTGDQAATALSIASEIGLGGHGEDVLTVIEGGELDQLIEDHQQREKILTTNVFARVTPAQKLSLVSLFQKNKMIVAMTGDGVNDAPALKKADIGIAMGKKGTQVAKEASDMILKDDQFETIILAIKQGRVIFYNIRSFVLYLLSCNISEIFVVALATLLNFPLPLMPLQILFLNLVTDVFPALALGVNSGEKGKMTDSYPMVENSQIINSQLWIKIIVYGLIITTSTLTAFFLSHFYFKFQATQALTVSFLTLGLSQLLHVFNMRNPQAKTIKNEITTNYYVWGAIALCISLMLGVVYNHNLAKLLDLVAPSKMQWSIIIFFSLIPLLSIQLYQFISKGKKSPAKSSFY